MKQLQQTITRLLWVLILIYGIGTTLYTLLQYTIGEGFVLIAWLNNGAYLLWAGAFVLIVPCIVFRWRIIATLLIPTLAFTLNYLPMYFPRIVEPPENSHLVSVLTYNINLGPPDMNKVAQDIHDIDADIVAIQELTYHAVGVFEAELSNRYPYRAFHPTNSFYGQGILSKYPITDDEYWKIYLGHQRTQINVKDKPITLYNVHPIHHILPFWGFDVSRRTEEVDFFLQKAHQDDTPILIVGDFNMTDQSADYQGITQTFDDTYQQVGYGMGTTFPAHLKILPSLVRIDYVFHSDDFTAIKADVLRSSGGSDHRPLVVELALDMP